MVSITWEKSRYTSYYGRVGGLQLFTISWHTDRSEPDWSMRTFLMGMESRRWADDARVALERLAEDVLDEWLASIGAARTEG